MLWREGICATFRMASGNGIKKAGDNRPARLGRGPIDRPASHQAERREGIGVKSRDSLHTIHLYK
jgi:hypothetical protein